MYVSYLKSEIYYKERNTFVILLLPLIGYITYDQIFATQLRRSLKVNKAYISINREI